MEGTSLYICSGLFGETPLLRHLEGGNHQQGCVTVGRSQVTISRKVRPHWKWSLVGGVPLLEHLF